MIRALSDVRHHTDEVRLPVATPGVVGWLTLHSCPPTSQTGQAEIRCRSFEERVSCGLLDAWHERAVPFCRYERAHLIRRKTPLHARLNQPRRLAWPG